MLLNYHYKLPNKPGDQLKLGKLISSSYSIIVTEIAERYSGIIVLVLPDTNTAFDLYNEICQFSNKYVLNFPDWETLPYDKFSPNQNIIASRLFTLYQLKAINSGILTVSINAIMQRVCPFDYINKYSIKIIKGQQLSKANFCSNLEIMGYRCVSEVTEYGQYSIHSSILDIYPIGSEYPCRVNFNKNKINNLHIFNIHNQRIIKEIKLINILPVHEFPINKIAIETFCNQWKIKFNTKLNNNYIYQEVSNNRFPKGIEYWQPLFFSKELPTLFSYFPANTLIIYIGNLEIIASNYEKYINQRYKHVSLNFISPILKPEELWIYSDELFKFFKKWPSIQFNEELLPNKTDNVNLEFSKLPDLTMEANQKIPLNKLNKFLKTFSGSVIFLIKKKEYFKELNELIKKNCKITLIKIKHLNQISKKKYYLMLGLIKHGFIDKLNNLAIICENDLLSNHLLIEHTDNNYQNNKPESFIKSLITFNIGEPVVHLEYGVGRYNGMIKLMTNDIEGEYVILVYANNTKLYVPVYSLYLINKYIGGTEENAPLHKLGDNTWFRIKSEVEKKIKDVAVELLNIYTKRAIKPGYSFKRYNKEYQMFCNQFPFKTTHDQDQAINDVLSDMCKPIAMDRLICGDVGFGKTEIAMRAAFLSVKNNKQVAVLVPTTLLAQQHFDTFRKRFINWPIRIEMLSRFLSIKEQSEIIKNIAKGKINILIGTHKLLQSNLKWQDLGLLIVDEEHRFGVYHKEKIKAIRSEVDILTMTATPIPRTLNMAIKGIRDLSIISTPPENRLPIKTFICNYSDVIVREAVLKEIIRGGQVYYLYNKIKNIQNVAKKLKKLIPEAHIDIAHGQMCKLELKKVINNFCHQSFNVLICTTIIETGIDIPTVNTIIIEDADHFGLAQLYQLRGRVGRSYQQAYAWFLISEINTITKSAEKRLEVINSLKSLCSGFSLSIHDLEIRGSGNLLGKEQSGSIEKVGFLLYTELLEKAVKDVQSNTNISIDYLNQSQQTEIELHIPSLLPENLIPDISTRLLFYKRIANTKTFNELKDIKSELINRFGKLPDPANNLFEITYLRQQAQKLGIRKVNSDSNGGIIEFSNDTKINQKWIINLIYENPKIFNLSGPYHLKFNQELIDSKTRIEWVKKFFKQISKNIRLN